MISDFFKICSKRKKMLFLRKNPVVHADSNVFTLISCLNGWKKLATVEVDANHKKSQAWGGLKFTSIHLLKQDNTGVDLKVNLRSLFPLSRL